MSDRFDALTVRQYIDRNGETKSSYTKIGTMFANAKGFTLSLDALPVPTLSDKGAVETRILLMPSKLRDGGNGAPASDNVPF